MRAVRMAALSVVMLMLISAGVGNHAPGAVASSQRVQSRHAPRSLTTVHFILHWVSNVEFAALWVAQQKGWWQQAGIKMTYKAWAPGVAPETDVPEYSGIAFGYQSGAAIILARAKGVPITGVYADTQKSVFAQMALASSGIKKLSDLKGKRIGYQADELYVPETMMSCIGLKDADWRPVQIGFDVAVLTGGHVDTYLAFVTNEPIALAMRGVKTVVFPAANYCYHFYDDVLFTTDSLIKHNPTLVRKVVGIVARGWAWALQHPAQTAKLTVDHYFPASGGMSAASNLRQQTLELHAFQPYSRDATGRYRGLMSASYWQDSVNTLYKYHLLRSKPSVATLFTNRFNPNR